MGENNSNSTNRDGGRDVVNDAHRDNKLGKQLFGFSMVFVVVFFIYITFLHPHSSPDYVNNLKGIATEQLLAGQAAPTPPADAGATAAPAASDAPKGDPWVATPEQLAKGAELFKINCALCHGEKGLGDGPAGASLNPPPRNYSEGKWKQGNSIIAIFNTISKGVPGSSMAPYESLLSEPDRWALALHVKAIAKNIVEPSEAEVKAFKEKTK